VRRSKGTENPPRARARQAGDIFALIRSIFRRTARA
jgi:hypothetical protein